MPKFDWIDAVDKVMNTADRAMDRFRKKPRRRLDHIPAPPVPDHPFDAPSAPTSADEKPLGDPGLAVQIYGRRTCDKSGHAVRLIQGKSLPARMIDMEDGDNVGIESRLIRATKSYKTPYVFVRGKYVGGFEELSVADKAGKLDGMLQGDEPKDA